MSTEETINPLDVTAAVASAPVPAASSATPKTLSVKIEVETDSNNVDLTKNVIIIPCDNIAFSDPHASTPTGKFYVISHEAAKMSILLKDLLEDNPKEGITIPKINGKTLSVIMMYVNYFQDKKHSFIPKPLSSSIKTYLSEWEKIFLDNYLLVNGNEKEHHVLIDVLSGANFLNIEGLFSLTCASVADMMKGKTAEQIRELFNIENDFTPEEEEEIRKETKWCDETE
jgi:S-phase kinase-associated protein 1